MRGEGGKGGEGGERGKVEGGMKERRGKGRGEVTRGKKQEGQ